MLIGLDPILSPDLLHGLRSMGHGDEIAIVDGNYPALEHARRLIRLDGLTLIPVLEAILSVLPVDEFVDDAIFRSTVGSDPTQREPVHEEILSACKKQVPGKHVIPLTGDDFYTRVKNSHTVVATSEPRLYANIIVRKGVIYPDPRTHV